ncbi:MAG: GGDEF domain-containing protein [Gammaproteobacteria bacterium]
MGSESTASGPGRHPARSSSQLDLERRTLELTNALQTTLDIDRLIELFSIHLRDIVPHEGLGFENGAERVSCMLGQRAQYSIDYDIVLATHSLGHVTIWRDAPLTDTDARAAESMLVGLFYPLRNAFLYRRALAQAVTDPLTGISNRAALDAALQREVDLAHRHHKALSFIMIDIDHFKSINDRYGHVVGDEALRRVAACVQDCIRRSDIVFRYGGEEFAVVLTSTELFGAMLLAQRIRAAVERIALVVEDQIVPLTLSAGVSMLDEGELPNELLKKADAALYQAKQLGRNRVEQYAG